MVKTQQTPKTEIGIAFLTFVFLGMIGALLQVGWPDIRDEFGLSQDAIGLYFIASTAGYFLSGALNGFLITRIGTRSLLLISIFITAGGLIGFGFSSSWLIFVVFGAIGGWGHATSDATLNTQASAKYSTRVLNWLHGFFGVGATLGPLVMSAIIWFGYGWRGAAITFAILYLILAVIYIANPWLFADGISSQLPDQPNHSIDEGPLPRETLGLLIVWIAIAFYFFYGGVEVAIGQWSFTILTEGNRFTLDDNTGRFWISIYWGTFTIGRFLFGVVSDRLSTITWLRLAMIGTLIGIAVFLIPGPSWLPLLSLSITGLSLAPIFPTLISIMPRLVGRKHAANTIGYLVAAAATGIAVLPSIGGVIAERASLEQIIPFIFVLAIIQYALFEGLIRRSKFDG